MREMTLHGDLVRQPQRAVLFPDFWKGKPAGLISRHRSGALWQESGGAQLKYF